MISVIIMSEENKEKTYKVVDKRFQEKESNAEPIPSTNIIPPLEQLSIKDRFIVLISSLMQSALIYLGEEPEPVTKEKKLDLNEVRNTISMIEMLKEKTRNNLEKDEQDFLEGVIYTLKMKYLEKSKIK